MRDMSEDEGKRMTSYNYQKDYKYFIITVRLTLLE
jgi:hypothetical protein